MQRITGATAIDIGGGKLGFVDEDLAGGIEGTDVSAAWLNSVQEEISLAIEAAGLTLNGSDPTQLSVTIRRLAPVGTLLTLTATQSIPNAVETAVTWPAEVRDTANAFTTAAATRVTVPAGFTLARVTGQVTFASNGTGSRKARILKNSIQEGSGLPAVRNLAAGGTDVSVLPLAGGVVPVAADDYLELLVQQDSGGALNLVATNTWLAVEFFR